jgi:DNA-binding CsgD family transcriptional regulator
MSFYDESRRKHYGLTAMQAEVMEWICKGKTNSETAQILGRSQNTVIQHLHRAFKKLDACNRTVAALKYERLKRER